MPSYRILIPFIAVTLLITACGGEIPADEIATAAPSAKKVKTATAEPFDYQPAIFASGQLASEEEARLSFKTGGIIRKIHVSEGQTVRAGQLLAELDLEEIQAQTQQANLGQDQAGISIENAKLALRLAERDYENAKGLYQDSVATLEQLQNAEVQLSNAKNQLAAAGKGLVFNQQQVAVANFNLQYSKIIAPSQGIILKKVANANEVVGPGTPILLFGSRDKALVIRVNVTDKDIINLQAGDKAEVEFDAYPNQVFRGEVRELAGMADPYTGTYEVEIEVFPEGKKLLTGFIGSVRILAESREQMLSIPVDALLSAHQSQGEVFLVANGKAVRTTIGIYKIQGDHLLVNKGLQAGDEVVVSGAGYLEDEQQVSGQRGGAKVPGPQSAVRQ